MRRETLVFTAAGVLFGLMLGYMAASWDLVPRPVVADAVAAAPSARANGPADGPRAGAPRANDPGAAAPADIPRANGPAASLRADSPAKPAGKPDEVKALESLAARQPADAAVRIELGNLHMDAERWNEAIRWYGEALALDGARPDVATDLGACLVSAGKPAEALAQFERALTANPGYRNALYNKGIALLHLGRHADAAAAWEDLLERHPGDPQLEGLEARIEQIRASSAAGAK